MHLQILSMFAGFEGDLILVHDPCLSVVVVVMVMSMSSRKRRFVDPQVPGQEAAPCPTDRSKCTLWQETTEENLQCLSESCRSGVAAGCENLLAFDELNVLPFNIARLDDRMV